MASNNADGGPGSGRFGPFFAVEFLGTAGSLEPEHDWLPVGALTADPDLLPRRIAAVRAALAQAAGLAGPDAVEFRVAVSITQLGLSARLVAFALAAAVDGKAVPRPGRLVFQDRLGGPYPLGLLTPAVVDLDLAPWPDAVLALVRPLAETVIRSGLSAKIVRGNIASALAGAAAMIGAAEPAAHGRARGLVSQALASPELTDTGSFGPDGFRRRSCCLIYRLAAPPTYCGDCLLAFG